MLRRKEIPGVTAGKVRRWLGVVGVLLAAGVQAGSALLPFLPRPEDFTLLWWANGPQHYQTMKGPPPPAVLCMQSGTLGLAIDTKRVQLLHAGRFARPLGMQRALKSGNAGVFRLPPLPLELSVQRGDRRFV